MSLPWANLIFISVKMYEADGHGPFLLHLECHSAKFWPFVTVKAGIGCSGMRCRMDGCHPNFSDE